MALGGSDWRSSDLTRRQGIHISLPISRRWNLSVANVICQSDKRAILGIICPLKKKEKKIAKMLWDT
jgi:hypothetical protein